MSTLGYKGASVMDTAYFYCPYIPGQPYVAPVWDHREIQRPTELQTQIMRTVQTKPMVNHED